MLRPYRSIVFGLLMCALLGAGVAVANAHALDDPVLTTHDLQLSFTDAAGGPTHVPYFSVVGASPGMRRQVASATLTNASAVPVSYDLSITMTTKRGASSLGDVLVATVSRRGDVVYHGPLSQLAVESPPPLAPNSSASYRIAVSWPDGGTSDNKYQGASLAFDLLARTGKRPWRSTRNEDPTTPRAASRRVRSQ